MQMQADMDPTGDGAMQAELAHAGMVVDKAIAHLMERKVDPLAIASALLGGSLGLLARTMGEEAIMHVLTNAMASVRAGELRRMTPGHDVPASARPPAMPETRDRSAA